MKLSTSLIAIKKINSNIDGSKFTDDELTQAAELILKAEGIINPLVVRRTSLDSYEVVDGHFEYHAAAKAREKNPYKGEMIGAFIIEPENEEVLKEQVKTLRKRVTEVDETEHTNDLIQQFEKLLQVHVKNLNKEIEQVIESVKTIEDIRNQQTETQEQLRSIADQVKQVANSVKNFEHTLPKSLEPELTKSNKIKNSQDDKTEKTQDNYKSMNVPQLKDEAKKRGIQGLSKAKKADLIAALRKADPI